MSEYITAYCLIDDTGCILNGRQIWTPETPPGPFKAITKKMYRDFGIKYSKFFKMDELCKLAFLTAECVLSDHPIHNRYHAEQVGIVLANSAASLDTDIAYYQTLEDMASPSLFVYTLPNIMLGEISIRHQIKGENACFVMENFQPETIVKYVRGLMKADRMDACIAGWVDKIGENFGSALFLIEKEKPSDGIAYSFHAQTLIELWKP